MQYKINKISDIIWCIVNPILTIIALIFFYIAISNLNIQYAIIDIALIGYISLMYNYRQDFKTLEKLIKRHKCV